jgi:hypothetical protein
MSPLLEKMNEKPKKDGIIKKFANRVFFLGTCVLLMFLSYLSLPLQYTFVAVPLTYHFCYVHSEEISNMVLQGIKALCGYVFENSVGSFWINKVDLLAQDSVYQQNKHMTDLKTPYEPEPSRYNFKVYVKIENQDPELAEIDSYSHISMLSESYFKKYIQKNLRPEQYMQETTPKLYGMGGDKAVFTPNYRPVQLQFQLGGCMLTR